MPAVTPIYAIPYPCAGENIDCDIFGSWAEAIQDAVSTVRNQEVAALTRPSARAIGRNQTPFVSGVQTNLVYQTEVYDTDNMLNLAVNNDRFTIQTGGWYVFGSSVESSLIAATTSFALAMSQNGTNLYRSKSSPGQFAVSPPFGLQVIGLFNCVPGDVIRVNYEFTGPASTTVQIVTTYGYMVNRA